MKRLLALMLCAVSLELRWGSKQLYPKRDSASSIDPMLTDVALLDVLAAVGLVSKSESCRDDPA